MNQFSLIPPQYTLIAKVIAVAVVIGGLLWYRHSLIAEGYAEGAAVVQAQYDAYRQQLMEATTEREKQNAIKDAQVTAMNEAAANEYTTKLAELNSDRTRLSRMLHNAQVRTCSTSLPPVEDITSAARVPQGTGSIQEADGFLDAFTSACLDDSAKLAALQAEVKGQL